MNSYTKIACAAALLLLPLACSKTETSREETQPRLVPVEFSLGLSEVQDDLTRSVSALFPEVENWIFDFYFVQFNASGISLVSDHIRQDVTVGDLTVRHPYWVYDGESTIAFIANISPADAGYGDDPHWQSEEGLVKITDNLVGFKLEKFDMSSRVAAAENGSLKHMPMCGYWHGTIDPSQNSQDDPFHMTVTLGRMMVRMNVNITNGSASAITSVRLDNAATKAYLYPQVENTPLEEEDYTSITNTVDIAPNASTTLNFYTAPNFCGADKVTSLTFTNAAGKSTTVELGNDIASGDYNLYMNTIYTFNINLK